MEGNPFEPPQGSTLSPARSRISARQRLRAIRHYSLLLAGIGLVIRIASGESRDVFVIVAPLTACLVVAGVLGWLAATVIGLFR